MMLMLAPMEGLLDFALRDALTRLGATGQGGGISMCVSEFIRVTDQLLPERVFQRIVPELAHGSRTPSGVPVRPQLLGSDPVALAENAARVAGLGPMGVDLNFGCPAKVVNRHGGGAALLAEPELIHRIVAAVRRAVPPEQVVSAKMRLGVDDDDRAEACAQAIEAAGASLLVVHARTKAQGYRPPAYWDRIADLRQAVRLPIVANGEIWTVDDALRCRAASGAGALMLGRGIVADPGLALAILSAVAPAPEAAAAAVDACGCGVQATAEGHGGHPWPQVSALLCHFWATNLSHITPKARAGRLKQWLNYLRRNFAPAQEAYDALRTTTDSRGVEAWMATHWGYRPPAGLADPAGAPAICSEVAPCQANASAAAPESGPTTGALARRAWSGDTCESPMGGSRHDQPF